LGDDNDRTFKSPRDRTFNSQSDHILVVKVIALSTAKTIAFLNMNQQDDGDRTFNGHSDRTFKSQNCTFKIQHNRSFKV
jgi:hypothetical protein